MRAADGDRFGGVIGRPPEGLTRAVPVALPAQHLQAGDADPGQRFPNEVGDDAEVFGDDAGAALAEDGEHALALRACDGSSAGVK